MGGEKALALIEKALAFQSPYVRGDVVPALGSLGGEKARDLLLARLAAEKDPSVFTAVSDTLKRCFPADPAVEKALKEFKLPEAQAPQPAPSSQPPAQPKPQSSGVF